jgi:hypothetical protein
MQLGTRWSVGDQPPARLPEAVVDAVRSVEAELAGVDTVQWRWTLTWLESRPIVELDDGTVIRMDAANGDVTIEFSPQ